MSRVGKVPIKVPKGVTVDIKGPNIKVKGPKGELSHQLPEGLQAKLEGEQILLIPTDETLRNASALQGVNRTLLYNTVKGVSEGFKRDLEIVGVGYRAAVKGKVLSLTVGYSHTIDYELPEGVTAKVQNNTQVSLEGSNKMVMGLVAAKIRSFRKPEPYQGKGIRYANERIVRKQGKAAGAK